jgi:hypothetical protein
MEVCYWSNSRIVRILYLETRFTSDSEFDLVIANNTIIQRHCLPERVPMHLIMYRRGTYMLNELNFIGDFNL